MLLVHDTLALSKALFLRLQERILDYNILQGLLVAKALVRRMHKAKSSNAHYDSVSAFYDKAWFYKQDSNFHRWYVERVAERLDVRTGERVVDFGGGDGTFSQTLHHKFPTATMLVVDPSPGMVEKAKQKEGLEVLLGSDSTFIQAAEKALQYDKMLLKEVIHHLEPDNLLPFFKAVKAQTSKSKEGILLTVTRMPTAEHYPFFRLAEAAWAAGSGTPHATFTAAMRAAGFRVHSEVLEYEVVVDKQEWFSMIRNRFWSTFHGMTDAEIQAGLVELDSKLKAGAFSYDATTNKLRFMDKLAFITARNPSPTPAATAKL